MAMSTLRWLPKVGDAVRVEIDALEAIEGAVIEEPTTTTFID